MRRPGLCASKVALAVFVLAACSPNDSSRGPVTALPALAPRVASTTVPQHVVTADYLGLPWGATLIPFSKAAPYLTWAETGTVDASLIAATGIKTMVYVNPNRATPNVGDEFYTNDNSTFAHTCAQSRVYDLKDGVTEWVLNPASPNLHKLFGWYVRLEEKLGHFDAVFEDVAGPLSDFEPFDPFVPSYPCDYSDASWLTAGIGLTQSSPLPVVFNGLSGLDGHSPSISLGLLAGSNAIGGNYEDCYSTTSEKKEPTWLWAAVENTEIAVAAKNKLFECMTEDTGIASSEIDARVYAYASFLLTYSPATSVYRTEFTTPSGLHVMPESGLVPELPMEAAPHVISSLERPGGTYAREYSACYYRGKNMGACVAVVNPGKSAARFPFTTFHHTLVLRGNGVLDGGTVAFDGPAPPAVLPATEATIVFP